MYNMPNLIMYITELLKKCDLQNRSAALAPFCKKRTSKMNISGFLNNY